MNDLLQETAGDTFAGLVAIVGRPNVGKSTLLNQLIGQKVSITSKKPQTTRHRIVGIDTVGKYQTVYVDTPGLHSEEKRAINRLMNKAAATSILDVELVVFVVEGTRWTDDDQMVLNRLIVAKKPVILAVNKVDLYKDKEDLLPHLQWLGTHNCSFWKLCRYRQKKAPTSVSCARSCTPSCHLVSSFFRKTILPTARNGSWPQKSCAKS